MALDSMKEIFERSARENIPFWEIVLQYDMEERQVSRQASMAKMLSTWQAIQDAADSYTGTQRSVSGLVGGDGLKMRLYARRGESIGGEFMDEVIVQAISMAESNACMRRIVAAPTAGSCGVVPAVLLPLCEREHYTQHELLEALYYSKEADGEKVKAASDMMEQMELSHLAKAHPYDLSGGEQQRLALGKILLLKPRILILDEPTKGLDPFFKRTLAQIFKGLVERGVTIFMVSHDIEFCAEYADRCAMFFDGDIVSEGEPQAFFSGNSFYTTVSNRMARGWFPKAVTWEEALQCVRDSM